MRMYAETARMDGFEITEYMHAHTRKYHMEIWIFTRNMPIQIENSTKPCKNHWIYFSTETRIEQEKISIVHWWVGSNFVKMCILFAYAWTNCYKLFGCLGWSGVYHFDCLFRFAERRRLKIMQISWTAHKTGEFVCVCEYHFHFNLMILLNIQCQLSTPQNQLNHPLNLMIRSGKRNTLTLSIHRSKLRTFLWTVCSIVCVFKSNRKIPLQKICLSTHKLVPTSVHFRFRQLISKITGKKYQHFK